MRAQAAELDLARQVALEEIQDDERPALGEEGRDRRMPGCLGQEHPHEAADDRLLDRLHEPVDQTRQDDLRRLVEELFGVGHDAEEGRHLFEHGVEERLLVLEVPVDQRG